MFTIDKEYIEYLHQCEEHNSEPMSFEEWINQYDEAKEMM